MYKRNFLKIVFVVMFAKVGMAHDVDWSKVIEIFQNLTEAVTELGDDGKEFVELLKSNLPAVEEAIRQNWPAFQNAMTSFSALPGSVDHVANASVDASSNLMWGLFSLGAFICIGMFLVATVCTLPKFVGKCYGNRYSGL
jgi:hypothetical protein